MQRVGSIGRARRSGDGRCNAAAIVCGTPISVVANHSKDATDSHLLRLQLDRPNLPNGCARAEWWEGTDAAPDHACSAWPVEADVPPNGSPRVASPQQISLPWGETSSSTITLREYEWAPSILEGLCSVAWSATRGDGQVRTRRLVGLLERRASPDRTSCNPRQAVGCTRHPEADDHGTRDHTHQMDQALDPARPTHTLGRLALPGHGCGGRRPMCGLAIRSSPP